MLRSASAKRRTFGVVRELSVVYPLVLGSVISLLLVTPIGIGGAAQVGAWAYVGGVIVAVTYICDRLLRVLFDRAAPEKAFVLIPIIASGFGFLAGWWATNSTMGGPV